MKTLSVSSRAELARPSPTLSITAKANAMKAQGIDVISFGAGEPDFPTPEPICNAAKLALDQGFTKYAPTSGFADLKQAIAQKLERDNGILVKPEQVVVSCGAKHSLYNALMMLLEPGDEVILFRPYWATYYDQVRLAGGIPVIVRTDPDQGFIPHLEDIKESITARTKLILVNSPCNPTGAVFPRAVMEGIAELALRNDCWVICDEIYEKLIYGEEHVSIAGLSSEMLDRTVTVNGCSKTYAMTGWRIGYAAGPLPLVKAMTNLQDQVTSNPNSFAQKGAIAALNMSTEGVEAMRAEFEVRRDLMFDELSRIPGMRLAKPKGAFYFLVDMSPYLAGIGSDVTLAELLLEKANVALVPGTAFDAPGYVRMTYAASREDIQRGVARMGELLSGFR